MALALVLAFGVSFFSVGAVAQSDVRVNKLIELFFGPHSPVPAFIAPVFGLELANPCEENPTGAATTYSGSNSVSVYVPSFMIGKCVDSVRDHHEFQAVGERPDLFRESQTQRS